MLHSCSCTFPLVIICEDPAASRYGWASHHRPGFEVCLGGVAGWTEPSALQKESNCWTRPVKLAPG